MESSNDCLKTASQATSDEFLLNDNNNNKSHSNNNMDDYDLKTKCHSSSNSPNHLDNEESTTSSLSNSSHSDTTDKKTAQNKFLTLSNTNNSNNSSRSPSPNTTELKQQQSVNQLISLLAQTSTQDSVSNKSNKLNDISKLLDVTKIISGLDNTQAANFLLNSINKMDLIKEGTPSSLSPSSSSSSSSSLSSSSLQANLTELIQQQVAPLLESMNLTNGNNVTINQLRQQLAAAAQLAQMQAKDKSPQSPTQQQKLSPTNSNWLQKDKQKLLANYSNTNSQAAAAAWTNALNAATIQSNPLLNQQRSSSQTNNIIRSLNSQLVQQLQKTTPSKLNTTQSPTHATSANSATMQQALNSIYSPSLQQKTAQTTTSSESDLLNNQLIDLIRQDPSQIENIIKLKSLYMNEDAAGLIEGLQQLDQTVPANLAAAAAAAAAAAQMQAQSNQTASNTNRNSPRSAYQNFAQQQLLNNQMSQHQQHNYHSQQQQQQQQQNNHHKYNQQPMYPTNQFSLNQQQIHHSYMQMTLQQQQLNQFQDYHEERFSRKVFVGGLPPDIDEDEIVTHFRRYGNLIVDWPHKAESKSYFPPKGYAFLIFQEERSVQDLIETCVMDEGKLYMVVSSPSMKDKPVQIRPWCLADSDFVMDGSQPLDPRKTIFVGGVPRPLKAIELAMIMDRFYGGVCYAGIDTDPELKYPKGAGRVAFSNQQSYIAAISARFVQLQHGEIDKRVEVKPYVLDDQMCDECQGTRCGGKFAPFFCANVTCLQYYCEACWATIHTRPGREYHKPLVKEGADRPRPIPYK